MSGSDAVRDFLDGLDPGFFEALADRISDEVFFLKDRTGAYQVVNRTLVKRCGQSSKADLVGRTATELFPGQMGQMFARQDRQVCESGEPIVDWLELHLYPDGREGWCLTTKVPVYDREGRIVGLAGTSRDIEGPDKKHEDHGAVADMVRHILAHLDRPHRTEDLAARAGLSAYQLDRRVRGVFGLTTSQLVQKTRIDTASRLLRETDQPIAEIGMACGYSDQSAFSRQFKATVRLTPGQYRRLARAGGSGDRPESG